MKKITQLLLLLSFLGTALAADNLISDGKSGNWQLIDNSGRRWNTETLYTTDGSGDVITLNGLMASTDNVIGDLISGNHQLIDNAGKRWNLRVTYTTDGNGNVIPVSGGGGGGSVTAVTGTAPVVSSGGTTPAISMAKATSSVDGYLFHTDWATFNGKQSALTFSSPLVNTTGTISIPVATSSVNGYLSSSDWTSFNVKQNAGNYITALTSDVSASGPGSSSATVNSVGGSSASNIHAAELGANAATSLDTASTIVKRDSSGNFSAGQLLDSAGTPKLSVDIQNRFLADSNGTTRFNYGNGNIYDVSGNLSENTGSRFLADSSEGVSMSWQSRACYGPAGGSVFTWYDGGAQVAGVETIANASADALIINGNVSAQGTVRRNATTGSLVLSGGTNITDSTRNGGTIFLSGATDAATEDGGHPGGVYIGLGLNPSRFAIGDVSGQTLFKFRSDGSSQFVDPLSGTPYFTATAPLSGSTQFLIAGPLSSTVGLFGSGVANGTNTALVTKDGHIKSTQTTAPTATVQASAGTGSTCGVANATDTAGQVTITTGTVGLSTGSYCTINFNKAYGVAPICSLTPAGSTLSTSVYVTSSTSSATVNFAVAGGISNTYVLNYQCIETQ